MACSVKPVVTTPRRRIAVNGVEIARDAVAREAQNHPAAKPVEALEAAALALVVREVLLQEARRIGIVARPHVDDAGRRETQEEALVRELIDREVAAPGADPDTCRRYFDNNPNRFRTPDLFEVRHILIAAAPGDDGARRAAGTRARELIATLRGDPGAFAGLAAQFSACPSAQSGGMLGQIGPGQTVPEFERALADSPVGEVRCEPVESRYGFHVIFVERRIPGRALPFEAVEARIQQWLETHARHTAICRYIAGLVSGARIEGVRMPQHDVLSNA
ncbi:MAG: peptidylprolyl isomerase [Alphaproteobacteria bacterium]|nr:MAG: peptidylprolyl isomerase [Alphaproteobacteria bacterium]